MRLARLGAAIGLVGLVLLAPPAAADVVTVACSGNPTADGSALSAAVETATSGSARTIQLSPSCTYELSGPLSFAPASSYTIRLPALTGLATIRGDGTFPLMRVTNGIALTLRNLRLTGGQGLSADRSPGGVDVASGSLVVLDSAFVGLEGFEGGALRVTSGSARVERSTFVDVAAPTGVGAAVTNRGSLTISASSISPRTTTGGAIYTEGTTRLVSTSILSTAQQGPVLQNQPGSTTLLRAVAIGGTTQACGGGGAVQLLTDNVIRDATCGTTATDPRLSPVQKQLADPFAVLHPAPGSPLVDAVTDPTVCTDNAASNAKPGSAGGDNRGRPHPVGVCDIGAVEQQNTVDATDSVAFDGTGGTRTVKVTAGGGDPTALGAPVLNGSGAFVLSGGSCGSALPSGTSCTYAIRFYPQKTQRTATLTLTENASGGPVVVDLTGAAAAAGVPVVAPPSPTASASPSATPAPGTSATPSAAPSVSASATPGTSATPLPTVSPGTPATAIAPELRSAGDEDGTWAARHADPDVPWFVRHLRTPSEVGTGGATLARSALLALLLLALLDLPVNVVNTTLAEHRDDLAAMLARLPRPPAWHLRWPQWARVLAAAGYAAALGTLLDPGAGLDRETAVSVGGLVLGLAAISTVTTSVDETWCQRRLRIRASLQVFPGFWLLALGCLLVSRVVGLHPGLLLGSLASVQVARELSARESGQRVLAVLLGSFAAALYAWTVYDPVAHEVQQTYGLADELIAGACATVFIGVVGGTLLTMVPVLGLDGAVLREWSRPVWAGATFLSLLGFVHVLLHKDATDPLLEHPGYLAALLGTYLVSCAAFVGFWRLRSARLVTAE